MGPLLETRAGAAARIRKRFEKPLAAYLDEMERRFAAAGLVPAPTKRGRAADEHWRWLAQRVVLGWTYDHIANDATTRRPEGVEGASVQEAVGKAAALAGMARELLDRGSGQTSAADPKPKV